MDRMTDRRIRTRADLGDIAFDGVGLVPVVAQDSATGRILMVAWANLEALERTLETRRLHFWSRSRGELWMKGETSGNTLDLVSLHSDCDADTLVALVRPAGPACHTGETSCFGEGAGPRTEGTLPAVWATLVDRATTRPEGSYTVRLLEDPNLRVKKLGEETAELVQALAQGDAARATEEAADLLYHTLAALLAEGRSLDDLLSELDQRR